jgi:hypothetical protein
MVVVGGINLHVKPLARIEYSGSKRNPKWICRNPRRQVNSGKELIIKY